MNLERCSAVISGGAGGLGGATARRLAGASDELKAALIANVAFPKRFGEAWEYASLVEMMLRTPFLNGQTIRLDGAMSTPLTAMAPPRRR